METTTSQFWTALQAEAEASCKEPILKNFIARVILNAVDLNDGLQRLLSEKLATSDMPAADFKNLLAEYRIDENLVIRDIQAIVKNDPAATNAICPFLFFKGFHALQSHRYAHQFWLAGRKSVALLIQSRVSELFAVDIHPAAQIGSGIMMDHATGIVIGETAVVEDDVLFWHNITLGGRSLDNIDRHPKIRKGVIIGAGSIILGNIEIGAGAKIAAGSLVLHNVPAGERIASQPATKKA